MNALLIKVLAVGLTLSQVLTRAPDQIKTQFNAETDQAEVAQILNSGCHVFLDQLKNFGPFKAKKFEPEDALQLLIETSKRSDGQSFTNRILKDLDTDGLLTAYRLYCKQESIAPQTFDIKPVLDFYNQAMATIPDVNIFKAFKMQETASVLDLSGERFSEIYTKENRRIFIPIQEIPDHVKKAFVAAEDQHFYQHKGVDLSGVLGAFALNLNSKGRPNGGSTITQQVIKNVLLNNDVTFERKMREMVLSARIEQILNKDQILELYLNFVFLGRTSWGVEMAAQSYFGKSIKDVSPAEAATLAALAKGPNFYSPSLHPDRAKDRRQYVLGRMKDDSYIDQPTFDTASAQPISVAEFVPPQSRSSFYFLDGIQKELKNLNLLGRPVTVRSTVHSGLQNVSEQALQDGLADYEAKAGRLQFTGPVDSLAQEIERSKKSWSELLPKYRHPMFDVHWPIATVLSVNPVKVGLVDGTELPLKASGQQLSQLKVYDLIFVDIAGKGKKRAARIKVPPQVQGAVVVLENKTGRLLSMVGGFSYGKSQLNRAMQTERQPGSTLKPFTFLSALSIGFQPNTLIPNLPIRLPPIERGERVWSPKNYTGRGGGVVTMRQAIEQSLNLPTVRMMAEMGQSPMEGLDYVRSVTQELGIYQNPDRHYPFVLGAQPARLIDIATAYATIANDGLKPETHLIESVEEKGQIDYQRPRFQLNPISSVDRVSFYQMRRILSGTVIRGTAAALKDLAGVLCAKTGTSNNENDAWFVGFTNDLVVAVWVGYDSKNVRANLGSSFTGAKVALPIAEKIIRASFTLYKDKEPIAPPAEEIRAQLAEYNINFRTGEFTNAPEDFPEAFRRDSTGTHIINSRNKLVQDYRPNLMTEMDSGFDDSGFDADFGSQPGTDYAEDPNQWNAQEYYQPGYDNDYQNWQGQEQQVDPYLDDNYGIH